MLRVKFSETFEVGNRKTGYYKTWNKSVDAEGSYAEVTSFIDNIASKYYLPGLANEKTKSMIDNLPKLIGD